MTNSLTGQKIDQYLIREHMSVGSTGDIYEAFDTQNQRSVIIKILQEQYSETSEFVQRFMREIRLVETLDHPNIIPVYGHGIYDDLLYLVMKNIRGANLETSLENRAFSPLMTWEILDPLASALTYAHRQSIMHRDIKPSNILIEEVEGNVHIYLSDFGMGKQVALDTTLTETGTVIGSPAYASPESVNGEDLDQRSDLYSLGIMTYEMLIGRLPFDAPLPHLLMIAHVRQTPPSLVGINPQFPPVLEQVVKGALAKNPADRYQTVQEFADAYYNALQTLSPAQQNTSFWK